jgi:hypothetical protein
MDAEQLALTAGVVTLRLRLFEVATGTLRCAGAMQVTAPGLDEHEVSASLEAALVLAVCGDRQGEACAAVPPQVKRIAAPAAAEAAPAPASRPEPERGSRAKRRAAGRR